MTAVSRKWAVPRRACGCGDAEEPPKGTRMDANKLAKLRAVGYRVVPVCALCRHSVFPSRQFPASLWGTCSAHSYNHRKHTDNPRDMSVVRFGHCDAFEVDEMKVAALDAFGEFFRSGA